jgi:GT2 family glycosyltransferase
MKSQVTIVVVPRERFSFAQRSLMNIYENTDSPFELIYIDAGGPAPLRTFLKEESQRRGFRLISVDCYLSPNRARNLGWHEVKTKYTVFIDNDALVKPGWLQALVRCADETDAWIVGPLYLIGEFEKQTIHMAGGTLHIKEHQGKRILYDEQYLFETKIDQVRDRLEPRQWDYAEFHCMLVRTDVLQRLGPLDESLLSLHEHIDVGMAVREAGGSVYIEPRAVTSYVPSPPYEWSDVPYFMLRWSEVWNLATVRHFNNKWSVSALRWFGQKFVPDSEETIIKFARGHRRFLTGLTAPNDEPVYQPELPQEQAELMVAMFLSVDRDRFDLTLARTKGDPVESWKNLNAPETFEKLPDLLRLAAQRRCGILLRPLSRVRANDPTLICLEMVGAEAMGRIRPFAFLTLEPLPQRYQCWLAVDTGNWRSAAALRKWVQPAPVAVCAYLAGSACVVGDSVDTTGDGKLVKLVEVVTGRVVSVPQLERSEIIPYLSAGHAL